MLQKMKPSLYGATPHTSHPIACISARILFKTGAYDGSPGSQLDVSDSHLPAMGNGDVRSISQSDIAGNVLKGSVLEQIRFQLVIITARDNAFAERKYILYTCNEATQSLTTTCSKTLIAKLCKDVSLLCKDFLEIFLNTW